MCLISKANWVIIAEFVQHVWDLCVGYLHMGTSYQRLKSSLDWMAVILDIFTYQPHNSQKKGITPRTSPYLFCYYLKISHQCFFFIVLVLT